VRSRSGIQKREARRRLASTHLVVAMDIKDIMGIKGAAGGGGGAKKQKTTAEKKPEGMSREVWQISRDRQSQQEALAPVVPTHAGLKDKRKVSARKVAWSWQPFKNSARVDDLMLKHWVKTGTGGTLLPGSNGGDVGGDYAFSKYNKKVDMVMYNDEEYDTLLKDLTEDDWSREETDYMFDLLARFDLRFIVVHDRWDYVPGVSKAPEGSKKSAASDAGEKDEEEKEKDGSKDAKDPKDPKDAGEKDDEKKEKEKDAAGTGTDKDKDDAATDGAGGAPKPRTVEDMKSRYYAIARKLLEARADNPDEAKTHALIREPFNARHEVDRKLALGDQMERTNALEREEQAILEEVKAIEERRRAEATALSARAGAAFSTHRADAVKLSIAVSDLRKDFAASGPSLPTAEGGDATPAPGAYARGAHVIAVAGEIAAAAVGTGGARGVRRIEQAVEELGVKPPQVSTRAVCSAWLTLRKEVMELLDLRKQLAKRQEELVGTAPGVPDAAAAAPAAAAAAAVFQQAGLPDTPRSKTQDVVLGPDGQPIGIRPAKRDQKRKMPARFDDTEPSPPRRSSEKRLKR